VGLLCTVQAEKDCINEELSLLQVQPKVDQALQPILAADDSQGEDWIDDDDDGFPEDDWEDETDEDDKDLLKDALRHQDENDEDEHKLLKETQAEGLGCVDFAAERRRCSGHRRRVSGHRRRGNYCSKCHFDTCVHHRRRSQRCCGDPGVGPTGCGD